MSRVLPDWTPTTPFIGTTNLAWLMQQAGVGSYADLHAWSVQYRADYWSRAIERLAVQFHTPFREVLDQSGGVENALWLPGARMNIVDSCFLAPPESPAIVHRAEGGELSVMSYGTLQALSARVAASLRHFGYREGDAIAILMPMTPEAVAIYLGIAAAGCVVVGIADSFRAREIAARVRIAGAVAVFTQDVLVRGGKVLPLYANVVDAGAPPAFVIPRQRSLAQSLRPGDRTWDDFLEVDGPLQTTPRDAADAMNILFSSGTTGEPKAIPWTHTTPIKCAADAHFHQNIHSGDVLVWPTNLGWMMGPWLIFASLMNRATMGLYDGAPTGREFGRFVQDARATMLGVVPSLVKKWRATDCMRGLDWSAVELFTSTGECSSADDMRWLMQLAGGRPIVEYCGGTEIGGAYIAGTLTRPCVAGAFNTPTLGLDLIILDEDGHPSSSGELFLVPPSIGLSTSLLNGDHHAIYFAGTPSGPNGEILRRHGDHMERFADRYWRARGRTDDTMNLGGIKVSAAEIEQVLPDVPGVFETAAVAVSPDGGPSQLVIYAGCLNADAVDKKELRAAMQRAIDGHLNPLFKIHDVVPVDALPRTASNKIMRRELRARYNRA